MSEREDFDLGGRVRVLEAIMPRVEKQTEETTRIIFAKLDFIKDNMVTQNQLKEELGGLKTAQTNTDAIATENKKKIQIAQLQIYALGILFLVSLCLGAAKTLSLIGVVGPKLLAVTP